MFRKIPGMLRKIPGNAFNFKLIKAIFYLKKANAKLYYVSIISDRFLVRSVTIHHILQPNGNRNVVGSICRVSCFHLERYDKIIKIVY